MAENIIKVIKLSGSKKINEALKSGKKLSDKDAKKIALKAAKDIIKIMEILEKQKDLQNELKEIHIKDKRWPGAKNKNRPRVSKEFKRTSKKKKRLSTKEAKKRLEKLGKWLDSPGGKRAIGKLISEIHEGRKRYHKNIQVDWKTLDRPMTI